MDTADAARIVESFLIKNRLSFKRFDKENSILFENIQVGNKTIIVVMSDTINLFINVKTKKDANTIYEICMETSRKNSGFSWLVTKNRQIASFKLSIPISNIALFEDIFNKIQTKLRRELPPFILGIITEDPESFFISQYKLWRQIPPEEQSKMIEDILVLKEKYFRSTRTKSGIVKKLNKIKTNIVNENKEVENKNLLRIVFGEDFTGSFEFYLIDFAALFRAIELNLIRLKLTDFFENFNRGGRKSE